MRFKRITSSSTASHIQPDFIAPRSEYEFQLIGSLSVGLLVRMLLRAGIVFLKNFIKDK